MITWIVQSNLGSTSFTAEALEAACEKTGNKFIPVKVIPFVDTLPEMPDVDGKFVLYGRTTLMLNAFASEKWRQGLFFNPEAFTPAQYLSHWGDKMLNADAKVIKIKDIRTLNTDDDELFVRPNDDLKRFAGGVMTYEDLYNMLENSTDNEEEPVNLNTEIVISTLKDIQSEWRLFMIDGKYVSGSQYQPIASEVIPPEVIQYAEDAAKIWTPSDVFVMDIALCYNDLKIIECNCFNGSGFYLSDLPRIVRTVSNFMVLS